MEVASSLKGTDPGCREWLHETHEYEALISGMLRVAHPKLFEAGRDVLLAMRSVPDLVPAVQNWTSVFGAISIVANRESPVHRDQGTNPRWFDALTSIGGDLETRLVLPGLGISLQYRSGTTVLFSGYTLAHRVSRSRAERVCFAHYMKDNVHERFGVEAPNWMNMSFYRSTL